MKKNLTTENKIFNETTFELLELCFKCCAFASYISERDFS